MLKTEPSFTAHKGLDETLSQLKRHSNIDAILLIGSAATKTMDEHSDYDIALILHSAPKSVLGINTYIDNRFADIFFYASQEVEELLKKEVINTNEKEGWFIHWSRTGKIIVDKSGLLRKVKEKSVTIKDAVADTVTYESWRKINYNFVQNMRYFRSEKELSLNALDIRLLYSIVEVFVGYFNVRKVPWRGEKFAVRWLQKNDSVFLALFQKYLVEVDRGKKMELYEKLVNRALEPVGGIWESRATSVIPTGDYNEDIIREGLSFWNDLVEDNFIEVEPR